MSIIARTICTLLESETPFAIATIVSHSGSTPRTAGSKMIVTADGRGVGSIGGGLLEARVMNAAAELIPLGRSVVMPVDLNDADVASMDMICGGQAEVLLATVAPTAVNRAVFEGWRRLHENGGPGCLLSVVVQVRGRVEGVIHGLVSPGNEIADDMPLNSPERVQVAAAAIAAAAIRTMPVEAGFVVLEPATPVHTAHLYGAGHVARPTAHLAALAGFRVAVADDRTEFANRERFPDAAAIRVLKSFANGLMEGGLDRRDFVVILTRGHLHDKIVLAQALRTGAGYIGMIGSRKKRDAIYAALLQEGYSRADIERVHSPIGIAIGAETPEEIAVSIVAELIAVRAGVQP